VRVVVTGDRWLERRDLVLKTLNELTLIETLAHGGCRDPRTHQLRGVDKVAAEWAIHEAKIPCTEYPADWGTWGLRAGPVRNTIMLLDFKPTLVLGFPGPVPKGTLDCMRKARRMGIEVREFPYERVR